MKNILYTQNESATKRNTIIVDGIVYPVVDESLRDAFRYINKRAEERSNRKNRIEKFKKQGKISSKNFMYLNDSKGIFIKSCFKEKDDLGRNMPFLFCTDTKDVNEAKKILKEYASMINRSCFENELESLVEIDKHRFSLKAKLITGVVLINILIIILIVVL
jgi:hypothetical protein